MGGNYIFSLQPTFTQGLLLGQLSVLVLLFLVLKYLFLDSAQDPFETSSYQPHATSGFALRNNSNDSPSFEAEGRGKQPESAEWFNTLLQQVVDVYRSKLRDDLPGPAGDEVARKRIEDYANRLRPAGFLDHITIQSIDLGVSAPYLYNARINQPELEVSKPATSKSALEIKCDVAYTDTLSLSLSTSCLFNYPMSSFARLPVSLTISLSQFKSSIIITPPAPTSIAPVLTISIPPDFTLDLSITSLMGSRAKLANVPKLHELIQHQVRRILATRGTWKVVLPGVSSIAEARDEIRKKMKENSITTI